MTAALITNVMGVDAARVVAMTLQETLQAGAGGVLPWGQSDSARGGGDFHGLLFEHSCRDRGSFHYFRGGQTPEGIFLVCLCPRFWRFPSPPSAEARLGAKKSPSALMEPKEAAEQAVRRAFAAADQEKTGALFAARGSPFMWTSD